MCRKKALIFKSSERKVYILYVMFKEFCSFLKMTCVPPIFHSPNFKTTVYKIPVKKEVLLISSINATSSSPPPYSFDEMNYFWAKFNWDMMVYRYWKGATSLLFFKKMKKYFSLILLQMHLSIKTNDFYLWIPWLIIFRQRFNPL